MTFIEWRGEGPVAIGLHGMPTDPEVMWPALPVLSHRCGNVHLPGYGRSASWPGPYDFAAVERSIVAAIPDEPVVLVGFSAGAFRALRIALRGDVDVVALVLLGASAGVVSEEKSNMIGFAEALRAGVDLTEAARDRFMTAEEQALPESRHVDGWLQTVTSENLAAELEGYASQPTVHERLREIDVPCLLIHGEQDGVHPVHEARAMTRALPNARLVTVPGGHGITVFHAEAVEHAIRGFMEEIVAA